MKLALYQGWKGALAVANSGADPQLTECAWTAWGKCCVCISTCDKSCASSSVLCLCVGSGKVDSDDITAAVHALANAGSEKSFVHMTKAIDSLHEHPELQRTAIHTLATLPHTKVCSCRMCKLVGSKVELGW